MPGLHDVIAAGTGPEEAGSAQRGPAFAEVPCRNCGQLSATQFCPDCGQRRHADHLSFISLLKHVVDEAFTLNGKLPRTLALLLFRPGRLTREYCDGRVVRYIRPLRLYLVSSVVFFLLLSLSGAFGVNSPIFGSASPAATQDPAAATETSGEAGEADAAGDAPGAAVPPAQAAPTAGWLDDVTIDVASPRLQAVLVDKKQRFGRMEPQEALSVVLVGFRERVPTAMFFLLPAFALMLKLLYVRRRRYYVEHMVFALHSHAFVFLLFSVLLLARHTPLNLLLMLWIPVYLFWAMRRVYGQGFFRTTIKFFVLSASYVFLLSAVLLGAFLATLILV
jgi:hypothetical protein